MTIAPLALAILLVSNAAAQSNTLYSVPPADAPQLAPRGPYFVGVRTVEIKHAGQIDILNFDKASGKAPLYDRPLTLEIWYPAILPEGTAEETSYELAMPRPPARTFHEAGKALRDAAPVKGKSCPLVIVSHGYPGSRYFLTYLTENLASKGYIVVAIDHTDSVFGAQRAFPSTLLNRTSDQLFTIESIEKMAIEPGHFLNGAVDAANVAIVGYSMGGFGALASAGAGYSKTAFARQFVPGGYFDSLLMGTAKYTASLRKEVKAVVAIAPWGEQPPYNSWDAEGLAGIRIPMLMIAGDQDDVSDFENGIRPVFNQAIHSDRCMLIFENARHNVGGNPLPPEASQTFEERESFEEPAWRKDRITAINQHFVTAFLDLYLKGDESRRPYLHPAPAKSNDGKWPLKQGESVGAQFSAGENYWKGFQRRWAVGLEMHCLAPAP